MVLGILIVASHIILPGHCHDNFKNADETDVDCGGSCPECLGMRFFIHLIFHEWPK